MSNQYRLVELGNSELLTGSLELVQQSNTLTGQLLAHLVELDKRKLHLELGVPSLFAYCVEALRMSEGTAGRRVTAARVCRRFPEVFGRVARGELHLCALCALAQHLNPANATELLETCKAKTRRQVEELLAARFPRPDVREQIRRLPARAGLAVSGVGLTSPPSSTTDESIVARVVPDQVVPDQVVPDQVVPDHQTLFEARRGRTIEHPPAVQGSQYASRAKLLWCNASGSENRNEAAS